MFHYISNGPVMIFGKYGGLKHTTNQEMELTGALRLLEMCPTKVEVTLRLDSAYVLGGIIKGKSGTVSKDHKLEGWIAGWSAKGWTKADGGEIKHLAIWKNIQKECMRLVKTGSVLNFEWVKGHSGDEGNDLADALSNIGIPS